MGGDSGGHEFDVSAESRAYFRDRRATRSLLLCVSTALIVLIAGLTLKVADQVASGYSFALWQSGLYAAIVLLVGGSAVVGLWGYVGMAPGALRVRLTEYGIDLEEARKAKHYTWSDLGQGFKLRDWSEVPSVAGAGPPYYFVERWGRTHALSQEAFESIIAASRKHQMMVRESLQEVGLVSGRVRVYSVSLE